jgi:hypothetical protein
MASKRVNVKAILADADLRRKLMVSTIQATQAREGIDTSPAQADRAYYVVTEAEKAAFFELERFRGGKKGEEDKRHEMFVRSLRGEDDRVRHDVARRDFGSIDGHPLPYERLALISHIFREAPALEPATAIVTSGLMTVQVERIMREHWEIPRNAQSFLSGWSPFAKGGGFQRFYRDVDLLVDLGPKTMPILEQNGCLRNRLLYGREGLTWVPRTQRGFNVQHLPPGAVFGKKGPIILPKSEADLWWILGVLNSHIAEFLLQALVSFGSFEVGVVQKLPVPHPKREARDRFSTMARAIHDAKADWDSGNEISTSFERPWVLRQAQDKSFAEALDAILEAEAVLERQIQSTYCELNNEAYRLYAIPDVTRTQIEQILGVRPPEVIWPHMEGKTTDQKRVEHVWRLLSYAVKRVIEANDDGIVPFNGSTEASLAERVRHELAALLPGREESRLEVEIVNELKRSVKGYRKCMSLDDWLSNAYFEYHSGLYRNRPIFWHIASSQGTAPFAFGVLVHYHRFDKNRMAKLRASYLRDSIEELRREVGLADKAGRTDDRIELQAKLEEAQTLDKTLQQIQEGRHDGPEAGERDFRILTPWKEPSARPHGWAPDLDDGVKVNIALLDRAGVLRVAGVAE